MLRTLLFCVMAWCIGCFDICRMSSDQVSQYLFLDEINALQACNKNMLQKFPTSFPDSLIEECAKIIATAQADVGKEFIFSVLMFNPNLAEYRHYCQQYTTLYQEFMHAYEAQVLTPDGLEFYDTETIIQFLKQYCTQPHNFKCHKIFMPTFDDIRPLLKEMPSIIPTDFVIQERSIAALDSIIQRETEAAKHIARFDKLVRHILNKLHKPEYSLYYRIKNHFRRFIKNLYGTWVFNA